MVYSIEGVLSWKDNVCPIPCKFFELTIVLSIGHDAQYNSRVSNTGGYRATVERREYFGLSVFISDLKNNTTPAPTWIPINYQLTVPNVGIAPTTPDHEAGIRTDPPPSNPMANGNCHATTFPRAQSSALAHDPKSHPGGTAAGTPSSVTTTVEGIQRSVMPD